MKRRQSPLLLRSPRIRRKIRAEILAAARKPASAAAAETKIAALLRLRPAGRDEHGRYSAAARGKKPPLGSSGKSRGRSAVKASAGS